MGEGVVAQPKKALSFEEAGDFGSGLFRLALCSSGVAGAADTASLAVISRLSCGGGDFRVNMDMVLDSALATTAVRLLACDSGEPGRE